MKLRLLLLVPLLAAWTPIYAQEDFVKLDLRVISSKPVVVDRGSGDGLVIGDVVRFFSRQGSTYRGNVSQLDERSAVVELSDPSYVPEPGTKAEVRIPRARLGLEDEPDQEEPPGPVPPQVEKAPEEPGEEGEPREPQERAPRYENQDEEWRPGMPLLAEVKPVRPEEREMQVSGRFFTRGHATGVSENGRSDSFASSGADILYENPFGRGGGLRISGEVHYRNLNRPDVTNESHLRLRLDRLSYYEGGTRFAPDRWEAGRFLQRGMPEFGVVDGVEWGRRRGNGDRFGASLGFQPDNDYKYDTGDDFQMAAYYEWVAGHREELSFATGFQKTLHNGDSDRDLLVTRLRYLPFDAWNYHATLWVDFYGDSDLAKSSSVEITQAIASANRRWNNGNGLDLTYTRIRFPDIERDGEFVPLTTYQEIANNRNDRLSLAGWTWAGDQLRLHGQAGGWHDEDDTGGDAAIGFEVLDAFGSGSRLDVTSFGTSGQFEDALGARISLGKSTRAGRWDLLYEFANHRQDGFSSDFNDIGQHRVRASRDWFTASGWTFSLYGEGAYWDEEGSWTGGFFLQKIF